MGAKEYYPEVIAVDCPFCGAKSPDRCKPGPRAVAEPNGPHGDRVKLAKKREEAR